MGLEEYEASLGNMALVFTILLQLTPIPIVVDIINNRGVGGNTPAPFLCSMLGSALWFKYAILIGFNMTMIVVNTVAMIMNTSYLVIYYLYSDRKSDIHRYLLAIVAIVATAFWFVDYSGMDADVARSRLGLLACLTSVAFTASPLVLVGHVVEIQSTEPLPLLLIVSTFFVSTLWFFYGMILKDQYVMVQNGISLLFGMVQLSLFAIYPRRRHGKVLTVHSRKRESSIRKSVSRDDRAYSSPESDSALFEAMESLLLVGTKPKDAVHLHVR